MSNKTKDYTDIASVETDKLRKVLAVAQDHYRDLSQEANEVYDKIVDIKIELSKRVVGGK